MRHVLLLAAVAASVSALGCHSDVPVGDGNNGNELASQGGNGGSPGVGGGKVNGSLASAGSSSSGESGSAGSLAVGGAAAAGSSGAGGSSAAGSGGTDSSAAGGTNAAAGGQGGSGLAGGAAGSGGVGGSAPPVCPGMAGGLYATVIGSDLQGMYADTTAISSGIVGSGGPFAQQNKYFIHARSGSDSSAPGANTLTIYFSTPMPSLGQTYPVQIWMWRNMATDSMSSIVDDQVYPPVGGPGTCQFTFGQQADQCSYFSCSGLVGVHTGMPFDLVNGIFVNTP